MVLLEKTTTTHPSLQLVIDRITGMLEVDQIFHYTQQVHRETIHQLYILIRQMPGQGITDSAALCKLILEDKPGYQCHIAYPVDIMQKINQGNLRMMLACHPDNLVYEHPVPAITIQLPEMDMQDRMTGSQMYFRKEFSRITAFKDGYSFYLQKQNLVQAGFMLHQVLELGFRVAENILIGKEKFSHSLKNHQVHIRPYCKELGELFHQSAELSVLDKIDESYKAARYEHDFVLSLDELSLAHEKALELIRILYTCHQQLLAEIAGIDPDPCRYKS